MITPSNHSQYYVDPSLEWKQFQELLDSPAAQSLKLAQFLLFELTQEQSLYLALCASTNVYHDKAFISVDGIFLQNLDRETGVCFISDVLGVNAYLVPLANFIARLGGKSAFFSRVNLSDRLWGIFVGYTSEPRRMDENELLLFSLLSKSVDLLVENVQLRFGPAFRLSEALSLETVSSALVEFGNLDKTLNLIIEETVRLLHAQDALVLLLEDDHEWFQVRERIGTDVETLAQRRMTVRNSLNGTVVMTGEPLMSLNAQTDPRADQARAANLNVHDVIIAPLKIRSRTIGTIAVHNKSNGYFNLDDLNVLRSFANQAAIAIDNAQLFNDLLNARNEIQQKAQMLQELLVQTMDIQECERRRIAADIHDRVVSLIVGALYELEGCIHLYHNSDDIENKLLVLKQLLNEAIDQTRRSIYNLWPATLDHMSLIPALHEMFKHQEAITGIYHTIHIHGIPYQLRHEVQIATYRIAQEAMNNAFHHGAASLIEMSICFKPNQFSLKIRDNGRGFNVQRVMQLPVSNHYGLIVMQERAQSMGGNLTVISELGKGSQITLEISCRLAMISEE